MLIAAVRKDLALLQCPTGSTTTTHTMPPVSSSTTSVPPGSLPSSTTTTLAENRAPVVNRPDGVYRRYPGRPIAFSIDASDPDGNALSYAVQAFQLHGLEAEFDVTITDDDGAHVSQGSGVRFLKNLTSDQLDAISPAYLRFINPGDLRVAAEACGDTGCHPEHVSNVRLSTMTTFAAHYTLPRYLAGIQDRETEVAAVDAIDADFDAETAPDGALASIEALRGPPAGANRTEVVPQPR